MSNPHDILNDSYLLRELPREAGVHFDEDTQQYIVTYRDYSESVDIHEANVDLLVEVAQRLVEEVEE